MAKKRKKHKLRPKARQAPMSIGKISKVKSWLERMNINTNRAIGLSERPFGTDVNN